MQTLFVLESLDNLRKNGRLTKLQAVVTSALKIKLLCGATPEGEICKLGQALSMKQALNKLVERIAADPRPQGAHRGHLPLRLPGPGLPGEAPDRGDLPGGEGPHSGGGGHYHRVRQ